MPVDKPCEDLLVAQQQIVEIAKELSQEVHLIVMDEPSAALTPRGLKWLFGIICELKAKVIGVIYISHRLVKIVEIVDRTTAFRNGRQGLIELMVDREIDED